MVARRELHRLVHLCECGLYIMMNNVDCNYSYGVEHSCLTGAPT